MTTGNLALGVALLLAACVMIVVPTKKEREMEARIAQLESQQHCFQAATPAGQGKKAANQACKAPQSAK